MGEKKMETVQLKPFHESLQFVIPTCEELRVLGSDLCPGPLVLMTHRRLEK